jgi:nucleoside-diphosphate-sugar epimerase
VSTPDFTVIGARGFIGRHLVAHLTQSGRQTFCPRRGDPELARKPLGHVIYAAGLSADFRSRPFETIAGHVCSIAELLEHTTYTSFLVLSSTRVYAGGDDTREEAALRVRPVDPDHLYNVSKLAGEAICLRAGGPAARVVRLSNVIGDDVDSGMFVSELINGAVHGGAVVFQSSPDSAKDYISVDDVARILPEIALRGRERIYNVARGRNTTNAQWARILGELTGARTSTVPDAPTTVFPQIDVSRLRAEFDFEFESADDVLRRVIPLYRSTHYRKAVLAP